MTPTQRKKTGSTTEHGMLHVSAPPDFLQAAHEWQRIFSEAWGTILLIVVAAGAGVVGAQIGEAITLIKSVIALNIQSAPYERLLAA